MAATDLKRTGLNNQKRGVHAMVSEQVVQADVLTDGSTIATLPAKSLIVGVFLVVTEASDTSDTLDVTYAGSVVANEVAADALGKADGTIVGAAAYSASGGDIVVKNGAQVVDANFKGRLVIEYIELDLVTGKYVG